MLTLLPQNAGMLLQNTTAQGILISFQFIHIPIDLHLSYYIQRDHSSPYFTISHIPASHL